MLRRLGEERSIAAAFSDREDLALPVVPEAAGPSGYRKRAVIIESQRLFVPFLTRIVDEVGAEVVTTIKSPRSRALRSLRPDVVVLDASHLAVAPLAAIRSVRRAAPGATIIVCAAADSAWCAVARAVGANVVLGAESGGLALQTAIATA